MGNRESESGDGGGGLKSRGMFGTNPKDLETRKLTFSLGRLLVYCNFDAQSLCQFTQGTGDEFDWLFNKGTTSSAPDTGPSNDVSKTGQWLIFLYKSGNPVQ